MSKENLVAALIIAEALMEPETREEKIRCYTGGFLGGLLHTQTKEKGATKEDVRKLLYDGVDIVISRIYRGDELDI